MNLRVGIAGLGTIGGKVADVLDQGIPGLTLEAITTRTAATATERMRGYRRRVPLVTPEEMAQRVDVVVDCVPKQAFRGVVEPALRAGRTVVTVSGAALLIHEDLVELARQHGGRIILATGALLGLDAIRAAAESEIYSVTMVTRKPPRSLIGAPHLVDNGIDSSALAEPLLVFKGNAHDGAAGFPSNVNVAAAVGLAGVGARNTQLEIWADPTRTRLTLCECRWFARRLPADIEPRRVGSIGRLTEMVVVPSAGGPRHILNPHQVVARTL